MIEFEIEIGYELIGKGVFGLQRFDLNKKQHNLNNLFPCYSLNNDYDISMNCQRFDFAEENLKIWASDL
jgi:hypothetical protein